jgi:MoxR-like ATPase
LTEFDGIDTEVPDDLSGVATRAQALADGVRKEVARAVHGQEEVVETALIALLAGGHALFEGVPGTAKTLLVRALAAACQAEFKRIQFTPDLMPSDIVGTNIFDGGSFKLRQGPVFTEFLLADEINRTPPKTQAALLEAMEERRVSIDGDSLPLPPVFTVFATQNPVEFEGTYPLPEAQVDRFLVKVLIDYPDEAAENAMLSAWDSGFQARDLSSANIQPVASVDAILSVRASLPSVKLEEKTRHYITQLVRATRQHKQLLLGASPRASVALLLASKTRALLHGRDYVNPDDIKAMCLPVLRHRVLLRPEAELEGIGADRIISALIASVEVPR